MGKMRSAVGAVIQSPQPSGLQLHTELIAFGCGQFSVSAASGPLHPHLLL